LGNGKSSAYSDAAFTLQSSSSRVAAGVHKQVIKEVEKQIAKHVSRAWKHDR